MIEEERLKACIFRLNEIPTHLQAFLSKKRGDWDPTLFMGICSLMASKHCSLDRDTVRLPDHSQAHTRRIA